MLSLQRVAWRRGASLSGRVGVGEYAIECMKLWRRVGLPSLSRRVRLLSEALSKIIKYIVQRGGVGWRTGGARRCWGRCWVRNINTLSRIVVDGPGFVDSFLERAKGHVFVGHDIVV